MANEITNNQGLSKQIELPVERKNFKNLVLSTRITSAHSPSSAARR